MMGTRAGLRALLIALLGLLPLYAHAEPPRVVATIQPLHGLTAAVMEGVAEPELLLSPGASPHTYSLRPSEARALAGADLVAWVGPGYERFLRNALQNLSGDALHVAFAELADVKLHTGRSGDAWDMDAGVDHGHGHDHNHGKHTTDYHLWLDPGNARIFVRAIRDALKARDPAHADAYAANAERTLERLDALDETLQARLAPLRDRPYVVFHDAYQYFEHRYGLTPVGSVTLDAERPPGARHVRDLRRRIRDLEAVCIFREPQFEPSLIETLTEGTELGRGQLDPLGASIDPGPDAYFELLEQLADAYDECLADAGSREAPTDGAVRD